MTAVKQKPATTIASLKDEERIAWDAYLHSCRKSERRGSYEEVEPHAWRVLRLTLGHIRRQRRRLVA